MVERLNWACGPVVREGWHHSDVQWYPGMYTDRTWPMARDYVGPIQHGLPWNTDTLDYIVSHHGLMMLAEDDLVPALEELRRVTKPGGWLRLSVPDLPSAINAWRSGYLEWFPLDAPEVDTAFCRYLTQGGATRSLFTEFRLNRLLTAAGWKGTREIGYQDTCCGDPGIVELDSRPDESIYMEAKK